MEGKSDNNKVMLAGKIVAPLKFQMEHKGEAFYRTILQVNRQSGQCDLIPLLLSQRLLDDTKNYEGQLVCVTGQFRSYNSHEQSIVISGISGTGKSVRICDLENQIVAGGSTVIALDLDGSHPVLSGEENTISAREDGIALKFLNAEMLKKSANETEMYISEVTDLLLSATKAGDRQKGILRNAISWALKNRQHFESDFEAIEAGLEEIGTEKALGVRDKIWPLLKCNVFRESKREIQKGKLNIISLEGLDVILATQSLARFTNDTLVALNQAAVRLYFRPALNETKKLALQIDSVNVERTMLMLKQLKIGESVAVGNLEFSGRHMNRPIVIKTNYKEKLAPSIRRL